MDIWAWVQAARKGLPEEESALARRLAYLPSWVNDQDHARVDAAVPEMLADVRRLGLPWLEVFVRHWRLQSLVFHRQEIAASLPEAVALLERAHRDDAKDCPQTVCVAQDVCASYGYADGPGYGEQRIAVSEETLARIDASWPCFHCISSERISALNDLGRHEEALEAVETALSAMRDAGHVIETGDFAWSRSEALRELGRVDEALRVAQRAESSAKGRSFEREKVLHVVTYQALLDRIDEATAALPEWEAVSDTASLFEDWCEAVYLLARRGAEGVGLRQLPSFAIAARQLLDQGCPRDAFRIACWGAEIAGGFGRLEVGRAFLDVAGRARRGLVKDLGADEQLGHATRAVDAVEAPVLPDSWEAFDAESSANGVSFDAAVAAVRRWPDQLGFALNVARHWRAQGFPQASRAVTEALLAANPDSADAWLGVGEAMRDEGDWEGLAGLLEQAPETADLHVHWLRSFLLEQRGDRPGAIAALDALLDTGRAGVGAALRKAAICRAMERWSDVIASIDVAIAMGMEPGSPDWDRIVAATVLGDWAVVRDGCARLGIELDDDAGPIEEAWGVVRVRYPEDSDHHSWAERTGPVTARVLSIHGPGPERERHADRVIFEPVPLDDHREYPLFRVVRFEDGGFESFALDGENPGEAEIQRLRDELGALGIPTRSTHSTQYLLKDPDTGASHPGCYVRIAVPRARPDLRGVLNTALKRFAAETGARLVWLELLEALGDSALDAQRALAERWGHLMPAQIHQADVDLQGLLAVLAENLYSTPEVALRELVQNAHDSIRRRSVESPHAFGAEIRVVTSEPDGVLEIHDTGAGLTDDEVRRFLATIGAGYTRLLRQQDPDAELIGKFGLGFLSAYVVSRRVEVETTSYQTPDRTWRFTSRDGRAYTLEEADARGVGTTVRLHLAPDHAHLANPVRVRTLLSRYGCLLPLPILAPERVNDEAPPWRRSFDNDFHRRKAELGFAQRFEPVYRPLATIPIRPADGGAVHGLVWVQDGASYATSDNRHVSLFVRGMLVTDDARRLLPEWAGFMGAVLQCDELVPTASREDVQRDALFGRVAAHVQESIVAGLRDLAENQTEAWRSIRRRHNEVLRGAALADPRLFSLLEDAITVPTTEGELPLSEVLERSQGRLVMTTGDESGTEEVLFRALSRPVVFGVRYAAAGFVRRYAAKRGVPVVQLGTTGGDRTLFPKAFVAPDVRERLEACFGRDDVEVVPTRFVPRSLPAVLVPDREVALKRRLEDDEADRRIASGLLALARGFTSQIDDGAVARLYVNLDAPLIDALLAAPDEVRGRLTAIVSGLAELTGRTHVEGVSSDLGVVLDRFTEAIVGLAGGVSRERR